MKQENMAGAVPAHRGAPERRCRSAAGPERSAEPGGRSGRREPTQPPAQGPAATAPQPVGAAGRRTGGGRRGASSTRGGTARPGHHDRFPAAGQDTRGEDRGHPAAAPLTLRWEPPPRPWRRRGGRELTAAEGRRWPVERRGTARRRRHRPSWAPPSLTPSLLPARRLRHPRGATHSPERHRARPGRARNAAGEPRSVCGRRAGAGHGPTPRRVGPGLSPAASQRHGWSRAPVGRLRSWDGGTAEARAERPQLPGRAERLLCPVSVGHTVRVCVFCTVHTLHCADILCAHHAHWAYSAYLPRGCVPPLYRVAHRGDTTAGWHWRDGKAPVRAHS